jgi:hypothetical protein
MLLGWDLGVGTWELLWNTLPKKLTCRAMPPDTLNGNDSSQAGVSPQICHHIHNTYEKYPENCIHDSSSISVDFSAMTATRRTAGDYIMVHNKTPCFSAGLH